jgi:hypothetical protein
MTNPIARRLDRLEGLKANSRPRIIFVDDPEAAERCRQEHPDAIMVSWLDPLERDPKETGIATHGRRITK